MIDVVYKLGIGSKFNNKELKYSLRSLKNFKNLGTIYIVGEKPHWIDKDIVVHIPASDPYAVNKDANLIQKLMLACNDFNLSEYFLNFSDDQLILKPIDFEYFKTPLINNKYLQDVSVPGKKLNRWQKRLKRTFDILKHNKLPYNCYEAHIPYLLNKFEYPKTLMGYDFGNDIGYVGNTLYFNTLKAKCKQITKFDLIRLEKQYTLLELKQLTKDSMLLNYTDSCVGDVLFEYLDGVFPEKSIYET